MQEKNFSINFKRPIFRNNQASNPAEAILRGLFKQVRELLNKTADPNEPVDNKTAIMLCAFITDINWATSLSTQLLEHGASINLSDQFKFNALHYAVIKGRKLLVELFLNSIDFDMNEKNLFGFTALHYAVDCDSKLDILEMLMNQMEKYRYSLESVNAFNMTPLLESIRHLNFPAAQIIIKHGANVDFMYQDMNIIDYISYLKTQVDKTPHYMLWKFKKSIFINENQQLKHHDSIIKTIKQTFINIAPDFDFRNCSEYVTERPKTCINMKKSIEIDDEKSWRTFMPVVLQHLEDKFSKSYRNNYSIEKMILNFNQMSREGMEGTDKSNRNKLNSKRNGSKSKPIKRGTPNQNTEKFIKKSINDSGKNK